MYRSPEQSHEQRHEQSPEQTRQCIKERAYARTRAHARGENGSFIKGLDCGDAAPEMWPNFTDF